MHKKLIVLALLAISCSESPKAHLITPAAAAPADTNIKADPTTDHAAGQSVTATETTSAATPAEATTTSPAGSIVAPIPELPSTVVTDTAPASASLTDPISDDAKNALVDSYKAANVTLDLQVGRPLTQGERDSLAALLPEFQKRSALISTVTLGEDLPYNYERDTKRLVLDLPVQNDQLSTFDKLRAYEGTFDSPIVLGDYGFTPATVDATLAHYEDIGIKSILKAHPFVKAINSVSKLTRFTSSNGALWLANDISAKDLNALLDTFNHWSALQTDLGIQIVNEYDKTDDSVEFLKDVETIADQVEDIRALGDLVKVIKINIGLQTDSIDVSHQTFTIRTFDAQTKQLWAILKANSNLLHAIPFNIDQQVGGDNAVLANELTAVRGNLDAILKLSDKITSVALSTGDTAAVSVDFNKALVIGKTSTSKDVADALAKVAASN